MVLASDGLAAENANAQQLFAGCLDEFLAGTPPLVVGNGSAEALCSAHFATLYFETAETPFYSAEHLTHQKIARAIHVRRDDDFHQDDRLAVGVASSLEDYRHSGYDRGHIATSGDEPDETSQFQSFALSNTVSQNADNNRG